MEVDLIIDSILYFLHLRRVLLYIVPKKSFEKEKIENKIKEILRKAKKFTKSSRGFDVFIWKGEKHFFVLITDSSIIAEKLDYFAKMSSQLSDKEWDMIFGRLLGYPRCCVDNYVTLGRSKALGSYILESEKIHDSAVVANEKFIYGFWNVGKYKDDEKSYISAVLGYIPCSPFCPETLARIDRTLDVLLRFIFDKFRSEMMKERKKE